MKITNKKNQKVNLRSSDETGHVKVPNVDVEVWAKIGKQGKSRGQP